MKIPTRANSRFVQKDLDLVCNLRDMVDRKESGSITIKNIYEDDPWSLNHVKNNLFKKNECFYFVPRTKRGVKTVKRSVPGRGKSEGGTWKRTGKIEEIVDENNKVHGYKQSLVYHKKVMGEAVKTNWLMTEYSLHKDGDNEFQDLVLCRIGETKEKKVNFVPHAENNIVVLPNQEQQEEASSGNEIERIMQQQEKDTQSNDNNDMMMHPPSEEKDARTPKLNLTEEEWYWFRIVVNTNCREGFHELMEILDRPQDSAANTRSSRS